MRHKVLHNSGRCRDLLLPSLLSCLIQDLFVVQGDFQYLGYVKVTGQYVSFFSESAYFYASATSAFTSVLRCFPCRISSMTYCVGIEYRWVAIALTDYFAAFAQETLRGAYTDVQGASGL